LALLALLLVVMTLLKTGTAYLSDFYIVTMRNGVVRDIRDTMYRKILSLPIGFFNNESKGDVMARISGDVSEIQASVMSSVNMLFKNPILIIVYLAMMIVVSWQLTLFVLVLLPIAGYVMGTVGKKLKRKSLKAQEMNGAILATVEETLSGLRIVKAFTAEKAMRRRFETQTEDYFKLCQGIERRTSMAHPMSEFLGTTAIAIVLWFGGSLILSGASGMDAAAFIYYMVIFYSIINPAKDLSKATYTIQKGMASLTRIDKILHADNPIKDPEKPALLNADTEKGSIELRNVCFSYVPGTPVLNNINITVKEGHTVALVGQSGSGKSTIADLVPRFWDVDKGAVLVNGHDVRTLKVSELRSLMGNVSQEPILFNDTFFNNIAFGIENATREAVVEAAKIANAHEFIMATPDGYDTNIGDRGGKLSGGQRQRISIARAILRNPRILILDEATSALDTESERLVQEALERLMANRTTLVIAHRLSTIVNADEICVIHQGSIVERGTHAQLMALDGYYKKLASMQSME
jgi:ATP-binding cassette subfamily B protein/subfamily B ATP-binding cassette protein MsbA